METGHAINNSNFKLLIDKCTGFGIKYNPSNTKLTIANLTTKWTASKNAQDAVNTIIAQAKEPINDREIIFEPLNETVTQSLASLNSTDASKQVKKDAKGLADDIRGHNTKKKVTPPAAGGTPDESSISKSHQSFVKRADNFHTFIELLKTVPDYNPNETEIKIVTLEALLAAMVGANEGMGTIINSMENAIIVRNKAMYEEEKGIVELAPLCKNYVKSVYKAKSAEYKLVNKIAFRKLKKGTAV